jgi:hypothetical protein
MALIRIKPGESGRIIVVMPYDPGRVAKIKSVPGQWWHAEEKVWSVPASEGVVERLLALFIGEEVEVDPALRVADVSAGAESALEAPGPAVRSLEGANFWFAK